MASISSKRHFSNLFQAAVGRYSTPLGVSTELSFTFEVFTPVHNSHRAVLKSSSNDRFYLDVTVRSWTI